MSDNGNGKDLPTKFQGPNPNDPLLVWVILLLFCMQIFLTHHVNRLVEWIEGEKNYAGERKGQGSSHGLLLVVIVVMIMHWKRQKQITLKLHGIYETNRYLNVNVIIALVLRNP